MQIIVKEVQCTECGAEEQHPHYPDMVLIRAFKVHDGVKWRSQCLVCSGYYSKDLKSWSEEQWDRSKGWF